MKLKHICMPPEAGRSIIARLRCCFSTTKKGILAKQKNKSDHVYHPLAPPQYGWAYYLNLPINWNDSMHFAYVLKKGVIAEFVTITSDAAKLSNRDIRHANRELELESNIILASRRVKKGINLHQLCIFASVYRNEYDGFINSVVGTIPTEDVYAAELFSCSYSLQERVTLGDTFLNLESDNLGALRMLKNSRSLALNSRSYTDLKFKAVDFTDFLCSSFVVEQMRKCNMINVHKIPSANPAHTMATLGRRMVPKLLSAGPMSFDDVYEFANKREHGEIKELLSIFIQQVHAQEVQHNLNREPL